MKYTIYGTKEILSRFFTLTHKKFIDGSEMGKKQYSFVDGENQNKLIIKLQIF